MKPVSYSSIPHQNEVIKGHQRNSIPKNRLSVLTKDVAGSIFMWWPEISSSSMTLAPNFRGLIISDLWISR